MYVYMFHVFVVISSGKKSDSLWFCTHFFCVYLCLLLASSYLLTEKIFFYKEEYKLWKSQQKGQNFYHINILLNLKSYSMLTV